MAMGLSDEAMLYKEMAAAVGAVILTWAQAENALMLAILIIDERDGPIAGNPELPRSLGKKIDYLKKSVRDVPRLEIVKDEGNALAKRFVMLKDRRDELVHGTAVQHFGEQFSTFRFRLSQRSHIASQTFVTIGDVVSFNFDVVRLTDEAMGFLTRVAFIFG